MGSVDQGVESAALEAGLLKGGDEDSQCQSVALSAEKGKRGSGLLEHRRPLCHLWAVALRPSKSRRSFLRGVSPESLASLSEDEVGCGGRLATRFSPFAGGWRTHLLSQVLDF